MKRKLVMLVPVVVSAVLAVPALAHEAGQWVFRAGVGVVEPKSDNLTVSEPPNTLTVDVDSGTSLTLMGTYMITENWAFDILAAWPFQHDVDLTVSDGTPAGTMTIPFAEVEHLPPTFSIQYHFLPDGKFQPYAGAGVNYTTFTSTDPTQEAIDALGPFDLDLDDSWGLAAQLGADLMLNENWLVNLDVRWIDIDSDVSIDGEELGTIEIDPFVYSLNLGYRF